MPERIGPRSLVSMSERQSERYIRSLPIKERAAKIYQKDLPYHLEKKMFDRVYTKEEIARLSYDKREERVICFGLSDTVRRLNRMVMHDLQSGGLIVQILGQKQGSKIDIELRDKLRELDRKSPCAEQDYTQEEYDQAVDWGWKDQSKMMMTAREHYFDRIVGYGDQRDRADNAFKTSLESAKNKEDRERLWQENQEAILFHYGDSSRSRSYALWG